MRRPEWVVWLACYLALAGLTAFPAQTQVLVQGQPPQAAPPPAKGRGVIAGQIVDARGSGVPDVIVTLQGGIQPIALVTTNREIPGGPRSTRTNSDGRFAFFELTPGTYALEAAKQGFIAGAYGRLRPGGQAHSITLADAAQQTTLRISIWENASLAGTVRDETGEPVVGVTVRALRRAIVHGRFQFVLGGATTTNDRGEYQLDTLTPGRYVVLVASMQNSLPAELLARLATLSPTDPESNLIRMAVGRAGGTAAGRQVGNQLWSPMRASAPVVPDPDDEGRLRVYPTTFHPSARTTRDAQLISLGSGEHRAAVDMSLSLVPAAGVSGIITAGGTPMTGIVVRLVPEYAEDLAGDVTGLEAATTVCDEAGRFAFVGVAAGQYYLQTEAMPDASPALASTPFASRRGWLNERIVVAEGGVSGLNLPLRSPVRISGQIGFDGTKPPPSPELIQRLFVSLEPIGFAVNRVEAPYQVNFDRNGQFVFPAVPPGRYLLSFRAAVADRQAMPDWETRGATAAGRDVMDRPWIVNDDVTGVVVTLTNHNTQFDGVVRDAANKVDPTAAVLLFTTEQDLWTVRAPRRVRALRASETGEFQVRGVPPGDYYVIAVPDVDIGDFPDPAMLATLSKSATRISMPPAGRVTQNLVVKTLK